MPSEKSARSSEGRQIRNRRVRSSTRTMVVKALNALQRGDVEDADTAVIQAVSALDKAATKGIIHDNNAARKKSRLVGKLNALRGS